MKNCSCLKNVVLSTVLNLIMKFKLQADILPVANHGGDHER